MGEAIEQRTFTEADEEIFSQRLVACTRALEVVLARDGFGDGDPSIGIELEVNLIDERAQPAMLNDRVLAETRDSRITHELNRFNTEINKLPAPLAGAPFATMRDELESALTELERAASIHGARAVTTGILATVEPRHLGTSTLTDVPRYRLLSERLRARRGEPFHIHVTGQDRLELDADDCSLEGAATSMQVHLRVPPSLFAATYNAAQLATAPVLALAGNSPLLFGHALWEETRIALFKQAVDDRGAAAAHGYPPARVSFGHGWCRSSALEIFEELVALYTPLLPRVGESDPLREIELGQLPSLRELRLHCGTVWRWNRPVYDPSGHLRIEMRALPAGPSVADMLANAAFMIGLTLALRDDAARWIPRMPFSFAEHNFYRAAQRGLDAEIIWPAMSCPSPRRRSASEVALEHLEIAEQALGAHGVDRNDSSPLFALLRERIESGRTGARWKRSALQRLEAERGRQDALAALVELEHRHGLSGRPVHLWPLP